MITSPKRQLRRKSRGAQLLEFAITLPLFLMMLLFSLDLGRIVFTSGVLHDAAFTSARAGAQVGGASLGLNGKTGVSQKAYDQAMTAIPGNAGVKPDQITIVSGKTCKAGTSADNYVTIRVTHKMNFITPGLNDLLGLFQGSGGKYQLKATGVARCEVAR